MEATIVNVVIGSIITGTMTGFAAFAAIRVELKYLRRDVDNAHKRLNAIDGKRSTDF